MPPSPPAEDAPRYEPEGIEAAKLRQISIIKAERGARIGRYIVASTTARYNDPADLFDIECDLVFPTVSDELTPERAEQLANNGCAYVVDAGYAPTTPAAAKACKKLGITYAPHKAPRPRGRRSSLDARPRTLRPRDARRGRSTR